MHCLGFGWSGPVSVGKMPSSGQINLEMKKGEKRKVIFASDMKKKKRLREDKDTADDEIGKEVVEEVETMDKEASTTMLMTKSFFSNSEDNNCGNCSLTGFNNRNLLLKNKLKCIFLLTLTICRQFNSIETTE